MILVPTHKIGPLTLSFQHLGGRGAVKINDIIREITDLPTEPYM